MSNGKTPAQAWVKIMTSCCCETHAIEGLTDFLKVTDFQQRESWLSLKAWLIFLKVTDFEQREFLETPG